MAAAAAANHSHRAGKLKQQNKRNKRSAASKRSLSRKSGGKIQSSSLGGGGVGGSGSKSRRKGVKDNVLNRNEARANRINEAKQRRIVSRKNVWNAHRFGGDVVGASSSSSSSTKASSSSTFLASAISNKPPRIIGIISLSEVETELEEQVRACLMKNADNKVVSSTTTSNNNNNNNTSSSSSVTVSYNVHSKNSQPHLTILTNSTSFKSQYEKNNYNEEDASVQASLDLCRICDWYYS